MDLRAIIPAGVAWLTLILLLPYPVDYTPVAIAGWTAGALLVVTARVTGKSSVATVAFCLIALALVATAAAAHADGRRPSELAAVVHRGEAVSATFVIGETMTAETKHVVATLVSVAGRDFDVPVLVFDAFPGSSARVDIGTTLVARVTMTATSAADATSYLLFASGPASIVRSPPWYLGWANTLRASFVDAATGLPGDGGRLLPGLAIGDTTAVTSRLDSAMKVTSLSHLTAVSGANCAIVVGLVMLAGGAIGLGRTLRVAVSIAVLIGFVVLVTPEPSVLRAAVMTVLVLLALASGRPIRGVPVLGGAVLVLLLIDPWLARNYGFALSVTATAGLLVLTGPIARLLSRWLPLWIAALIAVPLSAGLACQPILILLTPSLPLYGVIANILAEPAAPVATVIGLLGCLCLSLLPPLGETLVALAWLPSAWIGAVATYFAGLPAARIPWLAGLPGALLLAAGTVLCLVAVLAPISPRSRRIVAFAISALVIVSVAGVGGSNVARLIERPSDWQIAGCDVGQGDAMVVRSEGHVAVIDTGRDPALMTACLDTLGIGRIELLVLTHYDLDHVGGTSAVVGRVDRAIVGPGLDAGDAGIVRMLVAGGADVAQVSRGPTGILGDLRWRVLWPPTRLGDIEPGNPASVTVEFEPVGTCANGCLSSLFLGDLGESPQDRLLAANPTLGHVDVVKVAHHGSADQSVRLYERVSAVVGLIGVGLHNGYGHPTAKLLGILASTRTAVARTDLQGLVLLAPGEHQGEVTVWSERSGVGGDG